MIKNIYLTIVLVVFTGLAALAQTGNGAIKITLTDKATKEAIPFANVVAYKDGVQVGVATTDMDGVATIKPLEPGKYSVKGVYVGYQASEVKDVVVGDGKTAYVPIGLSNGEGVRLDEVEVVTYQVPLIDPDTKSGQTVTREDYQNLATKDVNSVAATTAGVYQADEGKAINVRGGRSGNTTYFVDGVKVFGSPNLPQQSIEQLNVITGGVPAMYGDLTSGAISISTRGPQSKYFGGIELISSQLTDPYGYNSLGFSVGGPLYKKKDSTKRTVVGFFVSGQGNYVKDPNPSFVPLYVLKDSKLQELKDQPLVPSPSGTGFIKASEYVTKDDMKTQKYHPNGSSRLLSLNGKVDYAPTANTNITLGGFYEYSSGYNSSAYNQVFNSDNNSLASTRVARTNLSITQKFKNATASKDKSQSLISNAFFRFLVSYENSKSVNQSSKHKNNYFDYGYVGKFDRTYAGKDFAYNYDFNPAFLINGQTINAYEYHGETEIAPVKFTPGTQNPDAALYTSYLVNHAPSTDFVSMNYIAANNGLRNGDQPQSIYNLFANFGTVFGGYTQGISQQFRVATSFNADIKNHAMTFGLEFDKRNISSYTVFAPQLWTRMRQLVGEHLQSLDKSNPILVPEFSGLVPYYYYDRLYQQDKQTQFSEKLLEKLGLPADYKGIPNIDALDPSTFSMDMFSATDLLDNSSQTSLVDYTGYTPQGEKYNHKTNIDDFLNKKDANGRNLYPVGSFQPIYASVYIMDKFDFKDIKFNVGLRVDRYDANQPVLKDKYALHDLAHVGDLKSIEYLPAGFADNIPSSISKDAAVYVAQNPSGGKSPLSIRGFREGDRWFDAEGNEISDPTLIASSDGRPTPLFKDRANYDVKMSTGGFTQYAAAINAMPRVAFSFPISDVANFFAHYDILTQRPSNSVISPLDYYFMEAASSTPLINNANQRPQQTIDYELGFSQVLNERKNASLTITSFYREMRNMINQKSIVGAYPRTYIMYDNIDFGTVKGMSFVFDFRRTGGSRINLNYTLQFAEGS
ncbi:MAG: TonB-dependent receptor plug domain-containing protein, partial [Bacteroidia bacterium]